MPKPVVPEHSRQLLEARSGGKSFELGGFLFASGEDWMTAIGYPLDGEFSPERLDAVLKSAERKTGASDCFVIAPELPERLNGGTLDEDVYYTLPADAPVPPRLRGYVRRAAEMLTVSECSTFTPEHRRLWAEFMGRMPLPPRIRRLYSGTSDAMRRCGGLCMLDARDSEGRLAGCLLLDWSLPEHVSYVLGAHSKKHYVPHAHDLLFAEMLRLARSRGRRSVLLGLGVNEGITRFKRKWGAQAGLPYRLASWQPVHGEAPAAKAMAELLLKAPQGVSKWKFLDTLPEQRECAMLWRLDRNGRTSWIGGSAHFFCCSFELSLRRLFENVDTVLLEGPIDSDSMDEVARIGRSPDLDAPRVSQFLSEDEVRRVERMVYGPEGLWARIAGLQKPRTVDVRRTLAESRQWYAFFSLWTAFLERNGWTNSVDMEVWNTALDMGKSVMGMESLAEQIASLESAPMTRIVKFMKDCSFWPQLMRSNRRRYLQGDLMRMMGTSAEFPTRTGRIISVRDQRFRERMRPYIERGGTAVFVGAAHMINLRTMLAEDGFTVTRVLPTLGHRLRAFVFRDADLMLPGNPDAPAWEAVPMNERAALRPAGAPAASGGGTLASGRNLADLGSRSIVPEQIPAYVRSVSGSSLRSCEGFAVWTSDSGDAVLVAFPAADELSACSPESPEYAGRLERAVRGVLGMPGLRRITVLAPAVPQSAPSNAVIEKDAWWGFGLPHAPGQKLRNMLRRAAREVSVTEDAWSPEHAELVDHYLKVRTLAPGTRHIFGRIGGYVESSAEAVLFSARDAEGCLQAFAVADYSAVETAYYMFAFRREDCPPGASDALLAAIAAGAEERGQTSVNLGLGIDGGIAFFKKKWGAVEIMPHFETSWLAEG